MGLVTALGRARAAGGLSDQLELAELHRHAGRALRGVDRVVARHAIAVLMRRGGLRTVGEVRALTDDELLARAPGLGAWHLGFVRALLKKEAAC